MYLKEIICTNCKFCLGISLNSKLVCLVDHGADFKFIDSKKLIEMGLDSLPEACENFEEKTPDNCTIGRIQSEAIKKNTLDILMEEEE